MSRFNVREKPRTTNLAGGAAYSFDSKTELVHAVLTTFLEDKFYESGSDRISRISALIQKNDPVFVSKLARYSRNVFNLRSVTTVLIGELSKIHRGDSLVSETIEACCTRPDDVTELVSYLGGKLSKQVKRGVRHAILNYDRYKLAKYRGDSKGVSMVDVFNLVHPKVQLADKEQKKAWKDLMDGNLISFDTWEVEISAAKTEAAKKKAWESLILEDKLGYMALLRNLNNLEKCDVSEKVRKVAVQKLTNEGEVKKSKQLPFRFYTAYTNVSDRQFKDAVVDAAEIALSNVPELGGKTLVALDCSGSMSGDPIEKGALFAATLVRANPRCDFILYDTSVKELSMSSRIPVLTLSEQIIGAAMGGGTNTALVFQYAEMKGKGYDRIIIISDNESWAGDAQTAYRSSKQNGYVYAIDIQGYGTHDLTGKKVFHLTGWSNNLLGFIGAMEKGESLVKEIERG